jgi:hypothetical protein
VCRFFQQGNCRNDRNCNFSHDSQSTTNASLIPNKFNGRPERTSEALIAREDFHTRDGFRRCRLLRKSDNPSDRKQPLRQAFWGLLSRILRPFSREIDMTHTCMNSLLTVDAGQRVGMLHAQCLRQCL